MGCYALFALYNDKFCNSFSNAPWKPFHLTAPTTFVSPPARQGVCERRSGTPRLSAESPPVVRCSICASPQACQCDVRYPHHLPHCYYYHHHHCHSSQPRHYALRLLRLHRRSLHCVDGDASIVCWRARLRADGGLHSRWHRWMVSRSA